MTISDSLKMLGGGTVVYVIMAACGGDSPQSKPKKDAGLDAVADVVTAIDVVSDVTTPIDVLTDPVAEAVAQEGGATCGTCTASGALRAASADTDPAQLISGFESVVDMGTKLADGPLVLTDARAVNAESGTNGVAVYAVTGGDCTTGPKRYIVDLLQDNVVRGPGIESMHGARYFVAAGETLCGERTRNLGKISWAGFRPY